MEHARRVAAFVAGLEVAQAPTHFRNPYQRSIAAKNLAAFLACHDPGERRLLLVGEAPGYRGAAISGVALASVGILTERWDDPWSLFGPESEFEAPEPCPFSAEATATMVWTILAELLSQGPAPLTWNAVPFHPVGSTPHSNGSVRRRDVAIGRPWLERLLQLFPKANPVAVGVRASEALTELGIRHERVRHPSRGGKREFTRGLREITDHGSPPLSA